jgi:hypothetical protein
MGDVYCCSLNQFSLKSSVRRIIVSITKERRRRRKGKEQRREEDHDGIYRR